MGNSLDEKGKNISTKSKGNSMEESENIGNSMTVFSLLFFILLVFFFFRLGIGDFWSGIIAFSGSFVISVGYFLFSQMKTQKQKRESIEGD